MKYYVYAIHTDDTDNRHMPAKPFDTYSEAAAFEREMQRGRVHGDNYFVRMIPAENDAEAEAKADALRRFPRMGPRKA